MEEFQSTDSTIGRANKLCAVFSLRLLVTFNYAHRQIHKVCVYVVDNRRSSLADTAKIVVVQRIAQFSGEYNHRGSPIYEHQQIMAP